MANDDLLSQSEKRSVLRNDQRVREQSQNGDTSSYIDHYSPEMGGRYSSEGAATVVGMTPNPYPPMPENNPWRSDPVPNEPPLGYRIDALPELEPSTVDPVVEVTGAPAGAAPSSEFHSPARDDVESDDAGASLSQTKDE
jgi:hypothetical protein